MNKCDLYQKRSGSADEKRGVIYRLE